MYFVDREKIEERLVYLEEQIFLFTNQHNWATPLEKVALERLTQMMIEVVLDVGNDIIDGFIMRDPGSYDDIVDILLDEKVISTETSNILKKLIQYRKMLVQQYTEVDHSKLFEDFSHHIGEFSLFSQNVRNYILNELGPVSAFKN